MGGWKAASTSFEEAAAARRAVFEEWTFHSSSQQTFRNMILVGVDSLDDGVESS